QIEVAVRRRIERTGINGDQAIRHGRRANLSVAETLVDLASVLDSNDPGIFAVPTHGKGPEGSLPITEQMLMEQPSCNLFGLTQNAGMGWEPSALLGKQVLILSTHGGVRAPDGTPIALGYHTGHWEVGLLVAETARQLKSFGAIPFAGA